MSNKDWDPNLTPEQNYVLRQEGTESPGSSPLNNEKREGSYHCVGCGVKLFDSNTKYESGSGWRSFFKIWGTMLLLSWRMKRKSNKLMLPWSS